MENLATIRRVPGGLPFIGHSLPLLRDPLNFMRSMPRDEDIVQIRMGRLRAVVVCDPELTRQVMVDGRTFDKGGPVIDGQREVVGNNIVTCPHSQHRQIRRLSQPAFHLSRFPGYGQTMTAQTMEIIDSWRDGQVVDIIRPLLELSSKILVEAMFSGAIPSSGIRRIIDDFGEITAGAFRSITMPSLINRLPTPANRRFDRVRANLRQTLSNVIAERRASGGNHNDLLTALLADQGHSGGRMLTDTDLSNEVAAFFIAGTGTTASTLSWALYLLACHPDIQDRLHAETAAVLAGHTAAYEHLPQLDLASRVITETLRLYPTAWVLTRVATADTRLGDCWIPFGTTVVVSPYLIHHRPDLFQEPERFNPDRWEIGYHPRHPRNTFIPFGLGARKCIGDQFALTEATLALANIIARWRLHDLPNQRVRLLIGTNIRPRSIRLRVTHPVKTHFN
ncbi:cytochrome P450 [Streptomyces sp. NPDC127051]|uniref:cytochrome P450 n=1 Tax=Streptomyces sp. NPDC127051 TaxID=3347119 RepID=UPI003662CBCB